MTIIWHPLFGSLNYRVINIWYQEEFLLHEEVLLFGGFIVGGSIVVLTYTGDQISLSLLFINGCN